ncbi:MAG: 50S ribosomal protein L11 [Planctomycetes bacterium]|nr:50S ribosomal protein L11 [Planctomycetota bacterium]
MAKQKEIVGTINLVIPGGGATPAPPVGPALGAKGVNIGVFVKQFNDATANKKGEIIPVVITVFKDKTFTFIMKEPPVSAQVRKAAGIEKGSGTAGPITSVGTITKAQVKQIAEKKISEMTAGSIEAAMKTVMGTARSMGVTISG